MTSKARQVIMCDASIPAVEFPSQDMAERLRGQQNV